MGALFFLGKKKKESIRRESKRVTNLLKKIKK